MQLMWSAPWIAIVYAEMSLDPFDITVVLTGHREGLLIHRTLRSIRRAIDFAAQKGIRCEVVVVLDRPDHATADYFERAEKSTLRVVEVDYGDPGLARNEGVAQACGNYVAFVDGDDLISRNWLADAFHFAEDPRFSGRRLALHPEANIFFGESSNILLHVDQESPDWRLDGFFSANYWTALVFASKKDLVAVPYRSCHLDSGFGFEDWDWNLLSVGAGIVHKVVRDTWHFLRLKSSGSRNEQAKTRPLLIRPSPIFERLEVEPDGQMLTDETTTAICPGKVSNEALDEVFSNADFLAEWRDLARIEPSLFPTPKKLKPYRLWPPSPKGVGNLFGQLLRQWGPAPSHVIFCDRYAASHSGLAALSYVQALAKDGANILIVTQEPGYEPISYRSSGSVRMLDFSKIGTDIEPFWQARLLGQGLVQRPPQTIHLLESKLGYEVLSAYGRAISGQSHVFASVPALKWESEGGLTGLLVTYFDRVAPYISGFLSDSFALLEWVYDTYYYPREKCHRIPAVPYASVSSDTLVRRRVDVRPKAIWLADHGKLACPAILLQIARLMPEWDFVIFQRHAPDLPWSDELSVALSSQPNISWAATRDSFAVSLSDASVFLDTSLVDGFPRVFIDALAAGIPIVAPAMRAITEFVDDETGYPVAEFFSPNAYAARLREVLAKPEDTRRRLMKAQRRISKECTWENFVAALKSVEGYL